MSAHGVDELGQDGSQISQASKAHSVWLSAGSASHNTVPSASGAGDQEVDSQAGPSNTRAPRVSAAQKALAEELKDELLFRLPEPLMAPIREECAEAFNAQNERIQGLETRLERVEAKLDLLLGHLLAPPLPPPPRSPPPPPPHQAHKMTLTLTSTPLTTPPHPTTLCHLVPLHPLATHIHPAPHLPPLTPLP